VYGYRAGVAAAQQGGQGPRVKGQERKTSDISAPDFDLEEVRTSLRRLMWEKVGIIRCGVSLNEAMEKLSEWKHILEMDFNTRRGLELKNMLTVGFLITGTALERKGSVGAHYRSDFKERGENWQRHIRVSRE
jgi:L-aspartate oxidase